MVALCGSFRLRLASTCNHRPVRNPRSVGPLRDVPIGAGDHRQRHVTGGDPVTGGEGTVNVTCSPPSGETFPIGMTPVQCTATDSLGRTGTCAFGVTVSKLAQLSKTKYLAFGDSITAGEITFPGSTALAPGTSG